MLGDRLILEEVNDPAEAARCRAHLEAWMALRPRQRFDSRRWCRSGTGPISRRCVRKRGTTASKG